MGPEAVYQSPVARHQSLAEGSQDVRRDDACFRRGLADELDRQFARWREDDGVEDEAAAGFVDGLRGRLDGLAVTLDRERRYRILRSLPPGPPSPRSLHRPN